MKKKCVIAALFLSTVMMTAGCGGKSIEDVKNFEQTSAELSDSQDSGTDVTNVLTVENIFKGGGSSSGSVGSKAVYAEKNEEMIIDSGVHKERQFTVTYEESAIAENVNELSKIMSDNDVEQFKNFDTATTEKFTAYDTRLKEDGTFTDDKMGMKQVALLFKVKIANTGNEDVQFNSMSYRVFCFKDIDGITCYTTVSEGFGYINIHDDHEILTNKLTLKPGEAKEIVMMELIPYELVMSYTRVRSKTGGTYVDTYKDIVTDGLTVDSLYTCYSTIKDAFPKGSPIIKLDVE